MSCHIRRNGEKDTGHRVDFAFTGDVDAWSVIQMTLKGVEIAMPMREWHALAVRVIGEATEQRDYWFTFSKEEGK